MAQGYEIDLFISYPRKGTCRTWVTQMLLRNLIDHLEDQLPNPVTYFIDEEIPPGANWEERIRTRLLASKVALCIWSPACFQSDWCMAEWKSMEQRQQLLREVRPEFAGSPVLFPVIFARRNGPAGRANKDRDRATLRILRRTNNKRHEPQRPLRKVTRTTHHRTGREALLHLRK